jgi:Tol biopolymer transport system component
MARDREGSRSIWQVSADGKGLHQLLVGWNDPASECGGVWAPDGKCLASSCPI